MIYETTVLGARWAIPRALVYATTRLDARHALSVYAHETTVLNAWHALTVLDHAVSRLHTRYGLDVLTWAESSLAGRWALDTVTAASTTLPARWAVAVPSLAERAASAGWGLSAPEGVGVTQLGLQYGLGWGTATLAAAWPALTLAGDGGATGAAAWPAAGLSATGSGEWGRLDASLPAVTLDPATTGARLTEPARLPAAALTASTRVLDGALTATWPALSGTAGGGADGSGAWPALALGTAWTAGAGTWPRVSLSAEGSTPWTASLQTTVYGLLGAAGYAGAVLEGAWPAVTAAGAGQSGSVGRLEGVCPVFSFYTSTVRGASALSGSNATLDGVLPAFETVSILLSAQLQGLLTLANGQIIGTALGVETSAAVPVNWCVNAETGETTSYTHFPFQRVVRFAGGYYGLNESGLYALGGNLDVLSPEDSSAITATVQSAPEDFKTHRHKRVPNLYVGMTTGEASVSVVVDGTTHGPYASSDGQRKVKLPRGALGRYWAFKLQNVAGGEMKVDGIEAVVETIRRRV